MAADAALPLAPFPHGGAPLSRRRERMEQWRRHSRLIHQLRRALPAATLAIILLLVGWVGVRGVLTRLSDLHGLGNGLIHMTNAHFYGRDGDAKPFVLGAAEAIRDDFDPHRIWLTAPKLGLDVNDIRESHISADRGVYRDDTRILVLHGHIALRDAEGNNLFTDQAIVDTVHGSIVGQGRVSGFGPTGSISAQTFVVYDQGRRIVFRGEVHSIMKRR
jgi:lipopolysaccharide export system protein LptC